MYGLLKSCKMYEFLNGSVGFESVLLLLYIGMFLG